MDDFMAKKRPMPILSQENHELWFEILELYFKGEGLWKTVVNGAALLDNFKKEDLKTQYTLKICIGEGDRERVRECKTARDI
jgi:hypothetical protein